MMAGWAQHESRSHFWVGKRVLELGSGTGLSGIALAKLGADVTLTDMPSVVNHSAQLLQRNVASNSAGCACTPTVQAYLWGQAPDELFPKLNSPSFDFIVAGDCAYRTELVGPLGQSIVACSAPHTITYLAFQVRALISADGLSARLDELGLEVESLSADEFPPTFRARASKFRLFKLRLKPHSLETDSESKPEPGTGVLSAESESTTDAEVAAAAPEQCCEVPKQDAEGIFN